MIIWKRLLGRLFPWTISHSGRAGISRRLTRRLTLFYFESFTHHSHRPRQLIGGVLNFPKFANSFVIAKRANVFAGRWIKLASFYLFNIIKEAQFQLVLVRIFTYER